MDIKRFNEISSNKQLAYKEKSISPHIPTPIDSDYERGYIQRYFIQKANDTESRIIEVDYLGFRKFSGNPFWTAIVIDWRIKGTDEQIKDSNSKSIKLHFQKIPKLGIYLPNLLQFKQKKDLVI